MSAIEKIQVEQIHGAELTYPDARRIAELWCAVDFSQGRSAKQIALWLFLEFGPADLPGVSDPRALVVRGEERMQAAAAAFGREIGVGKRDLWILAFGGVACDPSCRGAGLGRAVVGACFSLVDRGEYPCALFQTSDEVRGFYEKLGAGPVHKPIVNSFAEDPQANPFRDDVVLCYPADYPWPPGAIDLRGPGY